MDRVAATATATVALPSDMGHGWVAVETHTVHKGLQHRDEGFSHPLGRGVRHVVMDPVAVHESHRSVAITADLDRSFVADHFASHIMAVPGDSTGGQGPHRAAGKPEADHRVVHVSRRPHTLIYQGTAFSEYANHLVVHQPAPEVDVVVHGVQDQAPADAEVGEAGRWRIHVTADGPVEHRSPNGSLVDQSLGFEVAGVELADVTDHQFHTGGIGGRHRPVAALEIEGQGLLAQDVQSGGRTAFDVVDVGRRAAGDDDPIEGL